MIRRLTWAWPISEVWQLLLLLGLLMGGPNRLRSEEAIPPGAYQTPTGQRFVPTDVDFAHPVYETSFDEPSVLRDWRLEGGKSMSIQEGRLVLESHPAQDRQKPSEDHLVCWLVKEIPADFLAEFSVRPRDRKDGLNIVFFNARGIRGESIFAPTLRPRNGVFTQYHSGDLNNYHVSYWAGTRGSANLRKNRGFHLVSTGKDLVADAPAESFQTVRIHKRGGAIRVTVDEALSVAFNDDGKTYGPVHTHSGWIGLRQMGYTLRCEYDGLRIFPLKMQTN